MQNKKKSKRPIKREIKIQEFSSMRNRDSQSLLERILLCACCICFDMQKVETIRRVGRIKIKSQSANKNDPTIHDSCRISKMSVVSLSRLCSFGFAASLTGPLQSFRKLVNAVAPPSERNSPCAIAAGLAVPTWQVTLPKPPFEVVVAAHLAAAVVGAVVAGGSVHLPSCCRLPKSPRPPGVVGRGH